MTPVPSPAEDSSKPDQVETSDGEPAGDSDYDTDLECEQPREEYDHTGTSLVESKLLIFAVQIFPTFVILVVNMTQLF